MNNRTAVQWAIKMGLAQMPTETPLSPEAIKKRYYYQRKQKARGGEKHFSERPTPKSGIAHPQDKAIRDGAGFTYEPPPKIPYRPPGGTYGDPLP
jgi:hypothetical protein